MYDFWLTPFASVDQLSDANIYMFIYSFICFFIFIFILHKKHQKETTHVHGMYIKTEKTK